MKFVVTGGAGFIGSHIVDQLINMNYEVIIIDNLSTGSISNINKRAKFVNIDLCHIKYDKILDIIKGSKAVFHCAALPNVQYSIDYPLESNRINVGSIISVLELMRLSNINKIIYSSSCSIYGNADNIPTDENETIKPLSPYALQKYIGEKYCTLYNKIYNIDYTILRYYNVYGERMCDKGAYISVISHFIKSMKTNKILNITNDGNQTRDFVYVKDVVDANIRSAILDNTNNLICNIGYGKDVSVNQIAEWFGGHKKYGESRIEPQKTIANITLAKEKLKWYPKQTLKDWILNGNWYDSRSGT